MIDKMCNTIVNDKVKSVYSFNDYSIQDLLSKFFEQINNVTDLVNQNEEKIITQNFKLEEFIRYMKNEGIPPIVIETVTTMYNDGRLTELFNSLANNVIDKVEEFKTQVNSQLEQIVQLLKNKENNIINIKFPNISTLKGCRGDGATDDTQNLKAIINHINENYDKCVLLIPYGSYVLSESIVINSKIQIIGICNPILKFKLTNGFALDLVEFNNSRIENLIIEGENLTTEVTGLRLNGAYNNFKNIEIKNFYNGINLNNSNTYINTFDNILIHETSVCINADLQSANVTNSGERITFKNSTLCNSKEILFANSGVMDLFFDNCSFDYCNKMFNLGNGRYFFNNCHFENSIQTEGKKWYSTVEHLFQTFGDCKIYFNNIEFQLYGLTRIIDKNSTQGQAKFNNCMAWFRTTQGQDMYGFSEDSQWWGTSTMIRYSPFISKICVVSAIMGANYNNQQRPHKPMLILNVDSGSYEVKFNADDTPQEATYIKVLFN